jgi:hypothetical protein
MDQIGWTVRSEAGDCGCFGHYERANAPPVAICAHGNLATRDDMPQSEATEAALEWGQATNVRDERAWARDYNLRVYGTARGFGQ